jgi:hypothetical protein
MRYRKKPVVVEAWQLLGGGFQADAPSWLRDYKSSDGRRVRVHPDGTLTIPTLEGDHLASVNDWLIQGVRGEVYPCKPDIFEATYEEAP